MAEQAKFKTGFTIVETLIALSIITLVSSLVYYSLGSLRDRQLIRVASLGVKEFLIETRSMTLSARDGYGYGVHFETDRLIRFVGASFSAGDSRNETYLLDSRVAISNISLSGGGSDVYWNKVKGNVSVSGSVTVSISGSNPMPQIILINRTGLVSLQ